MTQAVNNTRVLGEVVLNERRYIAILHYYAEDGMPKEITPEMQNVNEIYRRAVQDVVNESGLSSSDCLTRLSGEGFNFHQNTIPHTDKTEKAWARFHHLLENPAFARQSLLASHSHSSVDFVDITDLTPDEKIMLRQQVIDKFCRVNNQAEKVELTLQERAILGVEYPCLSQGIRCAKEFLDFSIDHWSAKVALLSKQERLALKRSASAKYLSHINKTGQYDGPERVEISSEERGVLGREYPHLSRGIYHPKENYDLGLDVAQQRL